MADVVVRLRRRLRARIRSLCTAIDDELDDLEQVVWSRAWCRRDTFRGTGALDAWVLRIAANVAHDHRGASWRMTRDRREALQYYEDARCEAGPFEGGAFERAFQGELDRVYNAIAALPERKRAFFIGSCMLDVPVSRLAADFGVAVPSVWQAVARAKAAVLRAVGLPRGSDPLCLGLRGHRRRDGSHAAGRAVKRRVTPG